MKAIQCERNKKGLTQAQTAQLLNISRSFYGLIEKGHRRPTYGLAVKIANFFDVKIEDIFFDFDGFRMKRKKGT